MSSPYGESFKEALKLKFSIASEALIPSEWITANTYLKGRKFSFKDHEYQIQMVNDKHRIVTAKKCAQIGFSEIWLRDILCFLVQHQGSQGIMTQPTDKAMNRFAQSRIDILLEECPIVKKLGTGGVDSTRLKRIGTSFLNLSGTFGTNQAISTPSDYNLHDEVNFSNPTVRNQFKSRLQHSEYKYERAISTPTIPGYGVSELYDQSDRKKVMHKCSRCGHRHLAVWPDSFSLFRQDGVGCQLGVNGEVDPDLMVQYILSPWDYKVEIVCLNCRKPLNRSWSEGCAEWVAEYPERARDLDAGVSGYQISQLDVVFVEPTDIVKASDKRFMEGYKRIEDFHNFVLGQDYAGGEAQKINETVRKAVTIDLQEFLSATGTFIGIDLGNVCHIVVIKDLYVGLGLLPQPVIVAVKTITKDKLEEEVPEIYKQYGMNFAVSDAQPYTTTVEKIALKEGINGRMRICYFGGKKVYTLDNNTTQVTANRTQCLDAVTEPMSKREMFVASGLHDQETYWKHMYNLMKVRSEDDDGQEFYEYVKVGEDHYGLATGYAMLARRIFYDGGTIGMSNKCAPMTIIGVQTTL